MDASGGHHHRPPAQRRARALAKAVPLVRAHACSHPRPPIGRQQPLRPPSARAPNTRRYTFPTAVAASAAADGADAWPRRSCQDARAPSPPAVPSVSRRSPTCQGNRRGGGRCAWSSTRARTRRGQDGGVGDVGGGGGYRGPAAGGRAMEVRRRPPSACPNDLDRGGVWWPGARGGWVVVSAPPGHRLPDSPWGRGPAPSGRRVPPPRGGTGGADGAPPGHLPEPATSVPARPQRVLSARPPPRVR